MPLKGIDFVSPLLLIAPLVVKSVSCASSSQNIVNVDKFRALEIKVDKVASNVEKIFGFVSDIWTWMKEARSTNNDAMPSASTPHPLRAPWSNLGL